MSELKTMLTKIGNKRIAIGKDETKVKNLDKQIDVFQTSRVKTVEAMEQKTAEVEKMSGLVTEYRNLTTDKTNLLNRMKALMEKYDTIPWRADLRDDEKIENSEYPALEAKVAVIQTRLNEIPPLVNRIYYRRGEESAAAGLDE